MGGRGARLREDRENFDTYDASSTNPLRLWPTAPAYGRAALEDTNARRQVSDEEGRLDARAHPVTSS